MHEAVAGQPNKKARTGEGARLETELGRLVLGLRLGRGGLGRFREIGIRRFLLDLLDALGGVAVVHAFLEALHRRTGDARYRVCPWIHDQISAQ